MQGPLTLINKPITVIHARNKQEQLREQQMPVNVRLMWVERVPNRNKLNEGEREERKSFLVAEENVNECKLEKQRSDIMKG